MLLSGKYHIFYIHNGISNIYSKWNSHKQLVQSFQIKKRFIKPGLILEVKEKILGLFTHVITFTFFPSFQRFLKSFF